MVKRKYKDIESDKRISENEEHKMKSKKIRIIKDSDRTIALSKKKQGVKKYNIKSNEQLRMPSQNKAKGTRGAYRKNKSKKVEEEKGWIEYHIKKYTVKQKLW